MRHIFIINPAAGPQDASGTLCGEIRRAMEGLDYEIHLSEHPGHAIALVRDLCARYAPEDCRFYSCGGDGTLDEVVNGAMACDNAQIACIPYGTGNDFVKIFENRERFRDLQAQLNGEVLTLDAMEVNGKGCINICNFGLDARVAHWVHRNRRKLPFSGILAYITSLIVNFFLPLNRSCTLEVDGEQQQGEYAIIVAANGRCYGGGFHAVPEADPSDGTLDFLFVPRISRLTLLGCIGKFASGRHAEIPELIRYCRGREMRLTTPSPEPLCCDGEISLESSISIRILPKKVRFVQPTGCFIRPYQAKAGV